MTETITSSSPCRICMDAKIQQVSIFSGDLSRKVSEIADVQVQEGDGLPPSICEDCEIDLERCYRFRTQIIWADSKFRERLSVSEVVFEECHIKQEGQTFINEENQEDDDDDRPPSDNDDDDYDMRDDSGDKIDEIPQEKDQPTDPIDHVEIIENRTKQELHNLPSTDGNSQDEPLIVAQMKRENEPSSDPLMQSESQQPMDTESSIPGPSTSTPTVGGTENPLTFQNWAASFQAPDFNQDSSLPLQHSLSSGHSFQHSTSNFKIRLPPQKSILEQQLQKMGSIENPRSPPDPIAILPDSSDQNPNITPPNMAACQNVEMRPVFKDGFLLGTLVSIKPSQDKLVDSASTPVEDPLLHKARRTLVSNIKRTSKPLIVKKDTFSSDIGQSHDCGPKPDDGALEYRVRNIMEPDCIIEDNSRKINLNKPKTKPLKPYVVTEKEKKTFKLHNDTTCFVCHATFVDNELLLEHLRGTKFFCRVCAQEFNNHTELDKHFTSHKPTKCPYCTQVFFFLGDRRRHLKTNESCRNAEKRFHCKHCDKSFNKNRVLKKHEESVHSSTKFNYKCVVCDKNFITMLTLECHQKNVHNAFETIPCKMCHKVFPTPEKMIVHMRGHVGDPAEISKLTCELCSKIFSREDCLRDHMSVHDETQRQCSFCGKLIPGGEGGMKKHVYNWHSGRKFVCKFCTDGEFTTKSALETHRKSHHPELLPPRKSWFCEICGKEYRTSKTLRLHQATHSDERNFKCDICGATFKQKVVLQTHSRIHEEVKKYACETCGQSFRWKQTFDKHVKKCEGSQSESD